MAFVMLGDVNTEVKEIFDLLDFEGDCDQRLSRLEYEEEIGMDVSLIVVKFWHDCARDSCQIRLRLVKDVFS